jgi:agmatinase
MQSREEIVATFDPNGPGIRGQLFGLPFSPENSELVVIHAPWDVTVSYHDGTSRGPKAILDASYQVDLFVKDIPDAWKLGVCMLSTPQEIFEENNSLRAQAAQHISKVESGEKIASDEPVLRTLNAACEKFNEHIRSTAQKYLKAGKIVALVGGDHSSPLGFIRALAEAYDRFAVLQIDAHADLRNSYEGFAYSHASIMYNVLKIPAVGKLIQVGIRDLCDEEASVMQRAMGRIVTFYDQDVRASMLNGKSWDHICTEIIKHLPPLIYISVDIDGFDPKLCPNTGTPVPGGIEFQEFVYLLKKIVLSGKKVIGFDLSEVCPGKDDWDANVGARILYQLCNWTAVSHKKLVVR